MAYRESSNLSPPPSTEPIRLADERVVIDPVRRTLYVDDRQLWLPPRSLELLHFIGARADEEVPTEFIQENLWSHMRRGDRYRTIETGVKSIREQLAPDLKDTYTGVLRNIHLGNWQANKVVGYVAVRHLNDTE